MASGFVTEVLDERANTLKEFASVCAKGFGALAHQQNEPLETPIREAVVGKEHKKSIRALKRQLKEFKLISDKQLIKDEENALNKSTEHYLEKISVMIKAKKKLSDLLLKAQLWDIPTENHLVVKEMMVEHLKEAIEVDCDVKPVNDLLETIKVQLVNIDPEAIRKKQIDSIEYQIDFHEQSHGVDADHVEQSNKWIAELMDSFE